MIWWWVGKYWQNLRPIWLWLKLQIFLKLTYSMTSVIFLQSLCYLDFLKASAWFNWYFYELLFFRVWTGYTHPSIGNQAFWTGYTKSVNFIRYQALRTAFTWAIIRYCFVCFAFKTCCPFTVWKWALWAHFTVACDINNMIKRWTMLTFSSMGP